MTCLLLLAIPVASTRSVESAPGLNSDKQSQANEGKVSPPQSLQVVSTPLQHKEGFRVDLRQWLRAQAQHPPASS
eukprot:1891710-Amphidinium_carterae.2